MISATRCASPAYSCSAYTASYQAAVFVNIDVAGRPLTHNGRLCSCALMRPRQSAGPNALVARGVRGRADRALSRIEGRIARQRRCESEGPATASFHVPDRGQVFSNASDIKKARRRRSALGTAIVAAPVWRRRFTDGHECPPALLTFARVAPDTGAVCQRVTVTRRNVAGISVNPLCPLWFWRSNRATSASRSSAALPFLCAASNAFMVGP
jgi:hypothetical protein